jgi:hypothetical protein
VDATGDHPGLGEDAGGRKEQAREVHTTAELASVELRTVGAAPVCSAGRRREGGRGLTGLARVLATKRER